MSSRAYVGSLLFGATGNMRRRLRATPGEVTSVGVVQGESTDRSMSFEVEPAVTQPRLARDAWSGWANGPLFGVMAKPRPAWPVWKNGTLYGAMAEQRPTGPVWKNGMLYGVMADQRPESRPFGPS